jgi:hypothetical protein
MIQLYRIYNYSNIVGMINCDWPGIFYSEELRGTNETEGCGSGGKV